MTYFKNIIVVFILAIVKLTTAEELVIPLGVGSGNDLIARLITSSSSTPFIVTNKPGGDGIIAIQYTISKPGSVLLATESITTTNRITIHNYEQDYYLKLQPVIAVARFPLSISIKSESQFRSLDELVAYAKRNPGKLNVGYITQFQLSFIKSFEKTYHIKLTVIPYKSAPIIDLLNNNIDLIVEPTTTVIPLASQVKILYIAGDQPIVKVNKSLLSNQKLGTWYVHIGLLTSGATSYLDSAKLNAEFNHLLINPTIRQQIEKNGIEVLGGSITDYKNIISVNLEKQKK